VSSVGKLRFNVKNWMKFTNDSWILGVVTGYKIDFDQQPYQNKIPQQIPFQGEQWNIVNQEVETLIQKGAIIVTEHEQGEFISNLFIVPKQNGKFRPVINLKFLNQFVSYNHFKQETFNIVLDLIQRNDFFTKIDLCDAYFSIPIHEEFTKFLKFTWNGQLFKFVCMPFGLSIAPYLFTKILKPVYAWFRQQSIRCSYYIDDSLNMNQDKVRCMENTTVMLQTMESLGFDVNYDKSCLIPCQRIVFFGFILDSVQYKIFLTEEKIVTKAQLLLDKGLIVIRELASFIGLIINSFYAIFEAKLHYRSLERDKIIGLGDTMDFDRKVQLSVDSEQELTWWITNTISKNGKLIRPMPVDKRCRTDASLDGFGGIDIASGVYTNGRWSIEEALNSINYLELLAIWYTVQALYHNEHDIHIEIQSDNTTAISYINDFGGMTSVKMDRLAYDIWMWCLERAICLSAIHIPGVDNTADFYSRNFSDETEWMIKQDVFDRLCMQFFHPDIDLFASRLNFRLSKFVSWFPEPGASFVNAFHMNWSELRPYAFPPFNLVGKVINKVLLDKVEECILIFPFWCSQTWFTLVLENICSFPIRLPRHRDLLTLPHNHQPHPLGKRLRLIAAIVSGNHSRVARFQHALQTSSSNLGHKGHVSNINMHGEAGVFGIISGVQVPFARLKQ
jgi:hypothetical protein